MCISPRTSPKLGLVLILCEIDLRSGFLTDMAHYKLPLLLLSSETQIKIILIIIY